MYFGVAHQLAIVLYYSMPSFIRCLKKDSSQDFTSHESVIELTYKAFINSNFSIQPDLQTVINPGGQINMKNALVGYVRLKLEYWEFDSKNIRIPLF